jgi:hypothetical protein
MSERAKSVSSDVKIVAQAALLPLGTGLTLLDGYVLLGWAGVVLAVFAAVIFLVGWRAQKNAFCSGDIPGGAVTFLAVCVGILALVLVGAAS